MFCDFIFLGRILSRQITPSSTSISVSILTFYFLENFDLFTTCFVISVCLLLTNFEICKRRIVNLESRERKTWKLHSALLFWYSWWLWRSLTLMKKLRVNSKLESRKGWGILTFVVFSKVFSGHFIYENAILGWRLRSKESQRRPAPHQLHRYFTRWNRIRFIRWKKSIDFHTRKWSSYKRLGSRNTWHVCWRDSQITNTTRARLRLQFHGKNSKECGSYLWSGADENWKKGRTLRQHFIE